MENNGIYTNRTFKVGSIIQWAGLEKLGLHEHALQSYTFTNFTLKPISSPQSKQRFRPPRLDRAKQLPDQFFSYNFRNFTKDAQRRKRHTKTQKLHLCHLAKIKKDYSSTHKWFIVLLYYCTCVWLYFYNTVHLIILEVKYNNNIKHL